jgi:hypothetical protein
MPVLVSLATFFEQEPKNGSISRYGPLLRHINPPREDNSGPMNYREAVWNFDPSWGTSVSAKDSSVAPYEGRKMKGITNSDAQDPRGRVDEPKTAVTRKCEPKLPKATQKPSEPMFSEGPVGYFAEPIFTSSGKIAAAVLTKAPAPSCSSKPKSAQPKVGVNALVCSEIWFECTGLSVSQRLKRRRAERRACITEARIADMAALEQSIAASAGPLWLLVILMISQAFVRAASGIFSACMQRKWLARAVVMWMVVETATASPIAAASVSPPAPMLVAKFHTTLETPAAGYRRLLSKVTASNWEEIKTKCEAGDSEVSLSDSFDSSVYPGQIDFSGKTCVIIGQGQTLDQKNSRRKGQSSGLFFFGSGAGSSLEVHGLVLKNGAVRGCAGL